MTMDMSLFEATITVVGLAVITLLTRGFFLFSERELVMPGWVRRGLRYAPLAALTAVVVPEILMTQGEFIGTWRDARVWGALAASGYYFWRRGILGTIVSGMAVFLPLRLMLGW